MPKKNSSIITNKKVMDKNNNIGTKEAVSIIALAKEEALTIIANAAREAKQVVASDRTDAARLIASNAADAAKVANIKGLEDHDLLIKVDTKLDRLQIDIKDLTSSNVPKKDFDDLKLKFEIKNEKQDSQIDALEHKTANYTITMVLYSIAVAGMIGLTLLHILSNT